MTRICPNCKHELLDGEAGHYCPPSLGDAGFYTCQEKESAEQTMKEPTDNNRLMELIGKMEKATTDGDLSELKQDDIGDIYSWLLWVKVQKGNQP